MRGKKIDSEFLCDFITKCASNNIISNNEILNEAKSQIQQIDLKIKEVEALKKVRCKLLDVVESLDTKSKDKSEEIEILNLYNLKNPEICRFICQLIKNEDLNINSIIREPYTMVDIFYCIKQLLERQIISKKDNIISKGIYYDKYQGF
jgi:hypothetical protein